MPSVFFERLIELRERRSRAMATSVFLVVLGLPLAAWSEEDESAEKGPAPPEAAVNEESDPYDENIEEIFISGERRTEKWQKGPGSSVSFDASRLEAERIQDISDISDFTPNLEIKTVFAASNPILFIRGVGLDDFNANSTSAVAVYQDGIYMNSPAGQLFQFFDTESVQVLRGPQGGPYRNATAGAILVQSRKPDFVPGGYGSFSTGSYDLLEGEGAITGPIPFVSDHLAGRVAFKVIERDGFTRNRCADQPLANPVPFLNYRSSPTCRRVPFPDTNVGGRPQYTPKWVNDASSWGIRGQLLAADFTLGSLPMEWLLNVHGGRNDGGSYQFQQRAMRVTGSPPFGVIRDTDATRYADNDGDPFAGDYNVAGLELLDLAGASLKGNIQLSEDHELILISGYEWHDRDTVENTDANPTNLLASQYKDNAYQLSVDLRVESNWNDSVETLFGGYFIMEDLEVNNTFDQPYLRANTGVTLIQDIEQETRGFAFFGDVTWYPADRWTFHADMRYSEERKRFANSSVFEELTRQLAEGVEKGVWRGGSGSASLSYEISGEASTYIRYSRGFKPGHFNGGAVVAGQLIEPVKAEDVNSYEVGIETQWLDDRLSLRASFFSSQYQNQQVFLLSQDQVGGFPLPQLSNAQESNILGLEADLEAEPIDGLEIAFSMAFLDTEFGFFEDELIEIKRPPGGGDPVTIISILDYSGNQMVGAPRWSMAGFVQYSLPLADWSGYWLAGELRPRVSFAWKDQAFFDPAQGKGSRSNLPEGTIGQGAYAVLNASLTWVIPLSDSLAELEIAAWGRNLTNEAYKVQAFDLTDNSFGFVLEAYGDPRMFGITIQSTF